MRPNAALVLTLMAASLVLPRCAATQNPPRTAQYLEQLAAAVNGYSGGGVVYIVMCGRHYPYKVLGAFATAAEAQQAAATVQAKDGPCYVEGPYTSDNTYAGGAVTFGKGCNKQIDSSCPLADSTARTAFVVPMTQVENVIVTIRLRDGRQMTDTFPPDRSEAMFFTMSAVDKLLIPYLVRVYGVEFAAAQRQLFMRRYGARPREQGN
jgi:hypothetical protein